MAPTPHQEILDRVRQILAEQFNTAPESITRATAALDIDGWDSVTHVYVMLEIERRFGVTIRDDRVFTLDNVGDLVDLLAELTGNSAPK